MKNGFSLDLQGETFVLLPERAFFWPAQNILGLSDIHIGKAQSMQKMGIPVSDETHVEDLSNIGALVRRWKPKRVLILGDFIHQKDSWTPALMELLQIFFAEFNQVRWSLIIGNHERGSLEFLQRLPLEIFEKDIELGPFVFAHGHEPDEERMTIEGHVHPVVRLSLGPATLRLPCFVLEEKRLLIPSFGLLTGGYEIERKKEDRIFAIAPPEVFEVFEPKAKGNKNATRTLER